MNFIHRLINHLAAAFHQFIDHISNRLFIAGDRAGRDDDKIARTHLYLAVVGKCHARQSAHRLSLTACRDQHNLIFGVTADHIDINQHPIGDIQIAKFHADGHYIDHASAGECYFSPILHGAVDNLLHAADIRSKRCNNDAIVLCALKQHVKRTVHFFLGLGVAFALRVRRIGKQGQNPFVPKLSQAVQVDHFSLCRGAVDLKISRMDQNASGGMDGKGYRIRDGVVDMNELDIHAPKLNMIARLDHHRLHGILKAVLFQLAVDQCQGERSAINRDIDLFQQIRQRSDVILVAMCQYNPADMLRIPLHKGEIRDHQIHTEHITIWESHTAVHNHHIAFALKDRKVLANFVQSAEKINADRRLLLALPASAIPFALLSSRFFLLTGRLLRQVLLHGFLDGSQRLFCRILPPASALLAGAFGLCPGCLSHIAVLVSIRALRLCRSGLASGARLMFRRTAFRTRPLSPPRRRTWFRRLLRRVPRRSDFLVKFRVFFLNRSGFLSIITLAVGRFLI